MIRRDGQGRKIYAGYRMDLAVNRFLSAKSTTDQARTAAWVLAWEIAAGICPICLEGNVFYRHDKRETKETPQTLHRAGSWNVVLVLLPTASAGGCGLFF
jgi:hypothetical protein